MALIQPTLADPISPDEFQRQAAERVTPIGEYLGAKALGGLEAARPVEAFELGSLPSRYAADEYGLMPPGPPPADLMSKEQFDASPHARPGLEWEEGETEARAAARAAVHDRQAYRDSLIARSDAGPLGQAAGFGLSLGTAALDPTNYIPLVGAASKAAMVARFGRIGGALLMHGTEAAANTALFEPQAAETARVQGRSYGWEEAGADILTNALGGAVLGTAVDEGARALGFGHGAAPERGKPVPAGPAIPLAAAEEAALRDYKDLGYLTHWQMAQGTLRPDELPKAQANAKVLDAALDKTRTDSAATVYRGINLGEMSGDPAALVGKELPSTRFQSATTDRALAMEYAGAKQTEGGGGGVLLEMDVPAGSRGAWLDQYAKAGRPAENELLLPRDGSFRVTAARREGNVTVLTGEWQDATAAAPHAGNVGAGEATIPRAQDVGAGVVPRRPGQPPLRVDDLMRRADAANLALDQIDRGEPADVGKVLARDPAVREPPAWQPPPPSKPFDVKPEAPRYPPPSPEELARRKAITDALVRDGIVTREELALPEPERPPVHAPEPERAAVPELPDAEARQLLAEEQTLAGSRDRGGRMSEATRARLDEIMRLLPADGEQRARLSDEHLMGVAAGRAAIIRGQRKGRIQGGRALPGDASPRGGVGMSLATAAREPVPPTLAEAAPRVGKAVDELAALKEDAGLDAYAKPLPGHEPKPEPTPGESAKPEKVPTAREKAAALAAMPIELQDIEHMRREGVLRPEDEAALAVAEDTAQRTEGYASAWQALVGCVLRNL